MKVARLCPTLCDPMDYTVYGILQVRIREWVAFPFFRGSSQPGIEPRSPVLQADSLPAEPQGKPKNTGVGSLSLLQQNDSHPLKVHNSVGFSTFVKLQSDVGWHHQLNGHESE